jgi:hypothetical protein
MATILWSETPNIYFVGKQKEKMMFFFLAKQGPMSHRLLPAGSHINENWALFVKFSSSSRAIPSFHIIYFIFSKKKKLNHSLFISH